MTRSAARTAGRPREFDLDDAIDKALLVFRDKGYHTASITDLGSVMGLSAGSIYKAFGDKHTLFLAAFDRYTSDRQAKLRTLLETEESGFGKIRVVVDFYADSAHGAEGRRGCLVVGSVTQLSTFDPEIAERATGALKRVAKLLVEFIVAGQEDRSVAAHVDPISTSRTLLCLLQGMRLVGKTGISKAEMKAIAADALRLLA